MAGFDPVTTASQLATAYTQAAQTQLTTTTKTVQATSTALTKLQSALQGFDTALNSLSGKKGMVQNSAAFSSTAYGAATASAAAQPGSYPIFVEQVATAHQVMFTDLPALAVPVTGKLAVGASGTTFDVDFSAADLDGNGTLSQSEIARAINQAAGNAGKVSATVVSSGGTTQMILTAGDTGAASQITLDASGLLGDAGNAAEVDAFKAKLDGGGLLLAAAQDAVIYVGTKSPATRITQASNTFTAIAGVSMSFTKAMAPTDEPITLTVAADSGGTSGNVKSFVDAYNTLKKTLDDLTQTGSVQTGAAAAPFASDASIRALRNRLSDMLRQSFEGERLMDYGVSADRSGTLSLDTAKLEKKLASTPDGLDRLFGSTGLSQSKGLLGGLDKYLGAWTNSVDGLVMRRQEAVQSQQTSLAKRQERLDAQYNSAYQRYLVQFTQLQNLQEQMSHTSGIFDSLSVASTR